MYGQPEPAAAAPLLLPPLAWPDARHGTCRIRAGLAVGGLGFKVIGPGCGRVWYGEDSGQVRSGQVRWDEVRRGEVR